MNSELKDVENYKPRQVYHGDWTPLDRTSNNMVEVLPFLWGTRGNAPEVVACLHSLRPSQVRYNWRKLGGIEKWTVIIWTDDDTPVGRITKIEQYVEVGVPDGYQDADHLIRSLGWEGDA